jgi:hypothetical protein
MRNYPQIRTQCRFRCITTDYIANFYSKRRQRQSALTPLEVQLERAKGADREAISAALRKLKKTDAYMAAGVGEKTAMEEASRAKVIERRYIGTLLTFNFY